MKDNKLLAEYLGIYKEIVEDHKLPDSFHRRLFTNEGNEWQPNSNWNQLMMVVKKILKELDEAGDWCEKLHWGLANADIVAVYNACVEYIKSKG